MRALRTHVGEMMENIPSRTSEPSRKILPLDSLDGLEIRRIQEDGVDPVKTTVEVATYRGRRAVRMVNDDGLTASGTPAGAQSLEIAKDLEFANGSIELEVVGLAREGAPPSTRGFVGVAFHVRDDGSRYECMYVRFTNARADDQLLRNHTTQYVSHPDFSWQRLRAENPGVFESYVDIEPGAWTRIRVETVGKKAQLFVGGAGQPCLIVNDLKMGRTRGQIALWSGSKTSAYFSNLSVSVS